MRRAALYLHALRVAELRQLGARAARPARRRRFPAARMASMAPVGGGLEFWRSPAFAHADAVAGEDTVDLLGHAVAYPPADWELPGEPRLRRFHLQYGDEVLGWARRGETGRAREAVTAWIEANPPRVSDAWHPYVLSLRIGNWVAATSLEPELATTELAASLAQQAAYLSRNLEHDVLGNHLVANARALVLAGRALEDDALLERGLAVLRAEIPRQVLSDGGHYERSPLYHDLVLRDLLEVRHATGSGEHDDAIARMSAFSSALRRPDGLPAPFNDAPLELAPDLGLPEAPQGTAVFEETGYVVVRSAETWLAFDCGPVSPAFLPAHAHADALSLQLWHRGRPIVHDPGTFTYEPGAERDLFRATRAHSTVTVGGREQFTPWGAFRAGPLPRVRLVSAEPLRAEASYGGVRHTRELTLTPGEVRIGDGTVGSGVVEVRLPLEDRADVAAEEWESGWVSERLFERREIPVAVRRYDGDGEWRIALPVTL
jgi:hypothetical protein